MNGQDNIFHGRSFRKTVHHYVAVGLMRPGVKCGGWDVDLLEGRETVFFPIEELGQRRSRIFNIVAGRTLKGPNRIADGHLCIRSDKLEYPVWIAGSKSGDECVERWDSVLSRIGEPLISKNPDTPKITRRIQFHRIIAVGILKEFQVWPLEMLDFRRRTQ